MKHFVKSRAKSARLAIKIKNLEAKILGESLESLCLLAATGSAEQTCARDTCEADATTPTGSQFHECVKK